MNIHDVKSCIRVKNQFHQLEIKKKNPSLAGGQTDGAMLVDVKYNMSHQSDVSYVRSNSVRN